MLLSYTIIDFHLFYDRAVDVQIKFDKIQCRVSDTQVTVKACWPLVLVSTRQAILSNNIKQ